MLGSKLYLGRDGARENLLPVLRVPDDTIAYCLDQPPGQERPRPVFFDSQDRGYAQTNLGDQDGVPYFGDAAILTCE